MLRPGTHVNVISNETMGSIGSGKLLEYTPSTIVIETVKNKYHVKVDARTHHFKGYEPPVLLVRKRNK